MSGRKILRAKRPQKKDYINSLPDEVLDIILDHLDPGCVKNATLVCQRWNGIITRRFTLKVDSHHLLGIQPGKPPCRQEILNIERKMEKLDAMMKESQRCYRRIIWEASMWPEDNFPSTWAAFLPKLTNHLYSLELHYKKYYTMVNGISLFALLADALPTMPQLRWLTLKDDLVDSNCDIIPKLCSSSVKYLEMHSPIRVSLEMPLLETLKCTLPTLYRPDNSSQYAPSNLKHLTVFCRGDTISSNSEHLNIIKSDPLILRRFTKLEIMVFGEVQWSLCYVVPKEIFDLICETCVNLKELHIMRRLSKEISVKDLSKLVNLRVLGIGSWENTSEAMDLSTLTQIEEVRFYIVCSNVKLPMSVSKLTVQIEPSREDMIYELFKTNSHLTELHLLFGHFPYAQRGFLAPNHILQPLFFTLKRLEVLKFYGGSFVKSDFTSLNSPLNRLRRLHFINCTVDEMSIVELRKICPNLEELLRLRSRTHGH